MSRFVLAAALLLLWLPLAIVRAGEPRGPLPAGALVRCQADGAVHAVAVAGDGQTFAIAAAVRDKETGKPCTLLCLGEKAGKWSRQWYAPERSTRALAFSRDGKVLASGGSDWMVRLWDTATGHPLTRLVGHTDEIRALVFSPDGKVLASTADRDRTIYLWDSATGRELHQLRGRTAILAIAFSADGQTIAAVGENGKVSLYHTGTGRWLGQYALRGEAHLAALSPDGQTVAMAIGNGTVGLWSTETNQALHALQSDELKAVQLVFSPDGRVLAACDRSVIRLWETASGQLLAEHRGHSGALHALAFSRDGRLLVSASEDGAVLLWDLTFGAATASVPRDLTQLWEELAAIDATEGHRALWKLTRVPEKAVPLLRQQLQMVVSSDPDHLSKLIANLDHDSFAIREKASHELRALGRRAEPALRQALKDQPALEVRRRVEALLVHLDERQRPVGLAPDQLGRLRAVQALEQIGSREARKVLEAMADGDSSSPLPRAARTALTRMKNP